MPKELRYQISGDTRDFQRALSSADRKLAQTDSHAKKFGNSLSSTFRNVGSSAGYLGVALGAGIAVEAKRAVTAFQESNKVAKQTEAVLKSTSGAANVNANAVAGLAQAISRKTGVDDEAIASGENLLLTFTNVRNEAGKNNDIFTQATKIAADMSVALGQDLKSSNIQLGKSLNDPIKGVTALSRVGVSFTAQQKDQIKTLVESGKTLDAQKIILGELSKEFAGSAEAQATSTGKLQVAFGNLEEDLGSGLAPAVDAVADRLTDFAIRVEPMVIKASNRIAKTFGRKDLSLDQKFRLSAAQANNVFKPLVDEAKRSIGKMHVGDKLENAFVAAAPRIADALASAAPRAAGAFVRAFKEAGPWGKLVTVAFLASKLGAFSGAGSWAGKKLVGRVAAVLAADTAISTAAGGAGGRSGKAFATRMGARLKGLIPGVIAGGAVRGAFVAAASTLGIAAAGAFAAKFLNDVKNKLSNVKGGGDNYDSGNPIHTGLGGILGGIKDAFRSERLPAPAGSAGGSLIGGITTTASSNSGWLTTSSAGMGTGTTGGNASSAFAGAVSRSSGNYSHDELAKLWVQAGGNPAMADTAAAIALAESRGKPGAVSPPNTDGSLDRGLWQINSQHGSLSTTNVMANAKAAVKLSNGGRDFTPWTQYKNGEYRKYATGRGATRSMTRKQKRATSKLQRMIETADAIDRREYNYEWGGGHNDSFSPTHGTGHGSGTGIGFDCSGAVSRVLHDAGELGSPLTSGGFMKYGAAGHGVVTIYANAGHVWMTIAGRAFGTSSANPGGGAGWFGGNSEDGYEIRHVPGMGGASLSAAKDQKNRLKKKEQRQRAAQKAAKAFSRVQGKAQKQAEREEVKAHTYNQAERTDQQLAQLDVYDARHDGELDAAREVYAAAMGTSDTSDDAAARDALKKAQDARIVGIAGRGMVLQARLKRVNKLLKSKNLSVDRKRELTDEKASLVGLIKQLGQDVKDVYALPEPTEDPNQPLIDAINAAAEAAAEAAATQQALIAEQAAQVKELTAAQTADTELRRQIWNSQEGVLRQAVADAASSQIGASVGLAYQSPSFATGGVRY